MIDPNSFFNILQYGMSAYNGLGEWKYPLLFLGVFGYVYMSTKSVTTTVIGIIVTFGLFGVTTNIFSNVPQYTQFLSFVTLIGLVMLILALVIKAEQRW